MTIRSDGNLFERFAVRATAVAEAWMPDAYVFALAATALVTIAAFVVDPAVRDAPGRLIDSWGDGFWSLIPFTLQMAMIIVGGYTLASAPPIFRAITWMAGKPRTAKGAVVLLLVTVLAPH